MSILDWFKKEKSGIHQSGEAVGIALSGGGARGFAHIGVLKALHEHGVEPGIVSGTSMGSLVGLLYAAGLSLQDIQELVKREPVVRMVNMAFGKHGFFEMKGVRKILEEVIREDDFSFLKKPFFLSVSNLNTGEREIKNQGKLIEYVIASCSVPVIFAPVVIDGTTYVDGGLFNNLPAESIRERCGFLIGVNVNPVGEVPKFDGLGEVAERSFSLSIDQNVRVSKELCDFLIEPSAILNYTFWDFDKVDEIVEVGYQHTLEVLSKSDTTVPSTTRP